jgi:hypothetical protein
VAEFGGELLGVKPGACSLPEQRAQLEHSLLGPERHESDEATQVLLRVEPVQAGRSDQGVESGSAHGVGVAA